MRTGHVLEGTSSSRIPDLRSWSGSVTTTLRNTEGATGQLPFPICLSKELIFFLFWPEKKDVGKVQNILQNVVRWHIDYFKLKNNRYREGFLTPLLP